jgi:two-component system, LytTR family, response regulator
MIDNYTAVIIDDETLAREITKKYLVNHEDISVSAECSNGFDAIKKINELTPDLIFLDIQMPKLNGFEMLELLENPPVIIFTTAFDQFALKAFEANAADYLLKPYSRERFDEAIQKAFVRLRSKIPQIGLIKKLIEQNDEKKEFLERIVIKNGPKISIIPVQDVNYLEAQDDYVMIYSSEGKFLKQKTMKFFYEHLDPKDFIRVHRSYIVAVKGIKKIELLEKESYQVILQDKTAVPVSKTGYEKLKEILN